MPYLAVATNVAPETAATERFMADASATVARLLGKRERYVMVTLRSGQAMLFGGTNAPLAHLELKSLGLDEAQCPNLSAALCDLLQTHFAIPPERIYIELSAPQRSHWGWNRATF